MTIETESIGSGFGTLYEDTSGGNIILTISHPTYTSNHKLRVIPFGSSGSGIFNAPPAGTTANLNQEADNLATLIAAVYDASTQAAFTRANQVLADNTGTQPYPYAFDAGAAFAAGTGGGTAGHPAFWADLTGVGTDGSRWRLTLPGPSSNQIVDSPERISEAGFGANFAALASYLTGQSNGPTHAVKTNVVTHSGVPLAAPLFLVTVWSKRLRRRFRIA